MMPRTRWTIAGAAVLGLALLAWAFALGWLNRAPDTPYLAQSVQIWEQGRFIRFHGLSQWLGWLWPYAAIWVGLRQVLAKPSHAT